MSGLNTTGKPDTTKYELGRGSLFFATLDANDRPGAWRDLGNAPKFNLKMTSTELEHMSSRTGVKKVDATVMTEQKAAGSFEVDEISFQNLALLMNGTAASGVTNAATAGFTERNKAIVAVKLGYWYDIVNASGLRAYDITAGDLTVEKDAVSDVALVLDTDYELDLDMGRIFFKPTATNCAEGDDINITLAAKAGAKTLQTVQCLNGTQTIGALKFLSLNPVTNDVEREYQFHKVSIRCAGDLGLIDDKFIAMNFDFTAFESANPDLVTNSQSKTLTITTHDNANNNE